MRSLWLDLLGAQVHYCGPRFRTRVIEAGQGESLLLLHGVGGHAEAYARNVVRLGQQFRTLAIDFVWHGLSAKPPFVRSIPTYVEQIIELLDTLGIERAHIEGESLGGWVALWMALNHPERVNRLVLNTVAGVRFAPGTVPVLHDEGRNLLRERSLQAINHPSRETIRKRLEFLMAAPERVTDELVEVRYQFYTDPETQRALTQVYANSFGAGDHVAHEIGEERLQDVRAPVLVLWSDKNPGMGPAVGERLHSLLPDSQYYCIGDAAHWPQWEHPEEHDRVVASFLRGGRVA